MTLSRQELWALSYYRASELAGALLFGRLARRVTDPELVQFLTHHFAEEARHASVWTETIHRCGAVPVQITDTYQSLYGRRIGLPSSMAEVLVLTEVFEERIFDHFSRHAARPDVHPIVRETLVAMLEDEKDHVGWVADRLKRYDAEGVIRLDEARRRCREIDAAIYEEVRRSESALSEFLSVQA
jgi:hypothetical protein